MRLVVLTYIVVLLLLGTGPAVAQNVPTADSSAHALLRQWHTAQAERLDRVARFTAEEAAAWTLDGPFGIQEMEVTAHITGTQGDWDRTVASVRVNGRPVAPERWERMRRRRQHFAGPEAEAMTRSVLQLPRLIRWMRPASRPSEETLDDRPVWRFDLVPERPRSVIERLTLWLAPDGRLLQSRALLRPRRHPAPFIITTDYARVQGLDVPAYRHIEGIVQQRRRERTFSMLFDYTATYAEHALTFADDD
ncbi:MAG: hypothetical protein GVY18_09435 [Bacteroidetes bacterium]|jgi:hypothetical protein|nr:hypothetical protein [Bacteroidota bacterium]